MPPTQPTNQAIDIARRAVPPAQIPQHPLKSDFERIAQRMYTQNLALVQTNRTLSILRAIDLLILESKRDLQQLSTDISNAIIELSPYAAVSILSLSNYSDHFLNLQGFAYSSLMKQNGVANDALNLLPGLYMTLDGEWLASGNRNLILGMDRISHEYLTSLGLGPGIQKMLENLYANFNVRSFYLTKLRTRDRLSGVMIVGLEEPEPKVDDIELIERLAETTGIALDSRLLTEENQRFLKQLQNSNIHLKEIDEAKDEFISLVSHQLRTPLTSMKGFLSLVLDGDAGEISPPQRSMLQQAFDSSQRMVYLIADLLNASRLRSGKFIITNQPTNLPELISSELNQIKEAAAARKVIFDYAKPENFPTVLMDETKMRQVVMNFLDNALYYTPSGGHVTVSLKETDTTIEYMVTDSGIGVPKSEQPKLFSKLYRASNARTMRPEGTGLGLYMAKKVVVAQGGAIVFKSVEGHGSTFGFVFPREKMVASPDQPTPQPTAIEETQP
jgi:signal transduction histidine kinase